MTTNQVIKRYLGSWDDELNSVTLYRRLAERESNERIAGIYRHLANVEQQHADLWARKIKDAGGTVPEFRPSWRTKLLSWMAKRFGIDMVLPTIATMEDVDSRDYTKDTSETKMARQERSHAQVLRQLGRATHGGVEGSALAQIEGRHRTAGGNALRAAVLGAEDGLVSNLSLVMGVAGAALSNTSILLTGLAGMLAGAISMALGEWVSVQSSRELYQKQIATEKEEIETMPEEEIEELSLIYQARGLEEAEAHRVAIRSSRCFHSPFSPARTPLCSASCSAPWDCSSLALPSRCSPGARCSPPASARWRLALVQRLSLLGSDDLLVSLLAGEQMPDILPGDPRTVIRSVRSRLVPAFSP
jgi:rubrerythrin